MREFIQSALFAILLTTSGIALVGEESDEKYSEGLVSTLEKIGASLSEIDTTPIEGMFEVGTSDGNIFYITHDGKYVFTGDLHSIDGSDSRNLTEERRYQDRKDLLAQLSIDETLNFAPKKETEHVVYAFTDVDCSYCRLLHRNMEGYADAGIEIRYLAYPRAGMESETYINMVSAWCASDPKDAITKLKKGDRIRLEQCENPVASHVELGRKLKITGTPTLVLENGQVIPGYVPPDRLKRALANQ